MRRIAEFVLRHRRLVGVFWVVVVIAGLALTQRTNDRLVIDFSLPRQPGTQTANPDDREVQGGPQTANQIDREFHAGGKTAPFLISVTLPQGQTVTGSKAAVGRTFATVVGKV